MVAITADSLLGWLAQLAGQVASRSLTYHFILVALFAVCVGYGFFRRRYLGFGLSWSGIAARRLEGCCSFQPFSSSAFPLPLLLAFLFFRATWVGGGYRQYLRLDLFFV
jgi:hypothetical protein